MVMAGNIVMSFGKAARHQEFFDREVSELYDPGTSKRSFDIDNGK